MSADSGLPEAAVEALRRGGTIEAIVILRRERGLGLKEAKEVVDAFQRGVSAPGGSPVPAGATGVMPAEAVEALYRGRKIDAIRHLRVATGLGLKDAKDRIEAHVAAHPDIQAAMAAANAARGRSALGWLAAGVGLACLGYLLLK